ncbi:rhomboid family intramembrane serine protease [Sphingomonas sp. ASV193]|uniref:rhomboid family intramembrane serine protease n=1 Tax=Sphingomonas sp. ASV193 TaxID=3144405 RepID=UPI0032E8814F
MTRRAGLATIVIAALTSLVSLAIMASGNDIEAAIHGGFVAARVGGYEVAGALPLWLTPFSATLIHGGFMHLAVNMLMLLFVGIQVERVLGATGVIVIYLVGALTAVIAQWGWNPAATDPMVGASGAISGLFGAYALIFGAPKRVTGKPATDRAIHVVWLFAAWVVIQWMSARLMDQDGVTLATPAHIGGFLAGILLERPMLLWRYRNA